MREAQPFIERFYRAAARRPQSPFLEVEQSLSFGEAAEEVSRRAARFSGAAEGRPVVIAGLNTADWVLDFLAARAAGLVVVPVSHEAPPNRINELGSILGGFYFLNPATRAGELRGDDSRRKYNGAAFCLTSSGSTGTPRLALRSEASLLSEGERYVRSLGIGEGDRIVNALPLCHAFALGMALGGAVAAGCTLRLVERFLPRAVQRLLRAGVGTILPLVPSTARLLCQAFEDGGPGVSCLRHIVVGAGPLGAELEARMTEKLGRRPSRNYGSSETGATLGTTGEPVPEGTTGVPLPGIEAVVVPPAGEEVGALFVRTPDSFLGYLTPAGIDLSRISPDGWYSTGDLAKQDEEGRITVTGRAGEALRRGGRFVHPSELRTALLKHPAVAEAVIVGRRGEHGEDLVEAHVELRAGSVCTEDDLRRHLSEQVEAYKLPSSWRIHDLLPRTSGGKPDTAALGESTRIGASRCPTLHAVAGSHRLSTALYAAHRLGILSMFAEGQHTPEDVASACRLNAEAVGVLLKVLTSMGLLIADGGTYQAAFGPLGRAATGLLDFEALLQRTWLSDSAVEDALRNGVGGRRFEIDPSEEFLRSYEFVMGDVARASALHAWRKVELPAGPVLDAGRPAGAWCRLLKSRGEERNCLTVNFPPGLLPLEAELPGAKLAGIFIHNGVRRLAEPGTPLSLERLRRALRPDGALIISDVFTDGARGELLPTAALMLDWLTHGSLAWPSGAELIGALREAGFVSFRRVAAATPFELIIADSHEMLKESRDGGH